MKTDCTRRFELGLPLLRGMDMGTMVAAEGKLKQGDASGLSEFIAALGDMGAAQTVRRLAVIQLASDEDLKRLEVDKEFRAKLEDEQAEQPFGRSAEAAFGFFGGLMASLGVALDSSAPAAETGEVPAAMSPEGSPSGDC